MVALSTLISVSVCATVSAASAGSATYCPTAEDLVVAYETGGTVQLNDQGWTTHGWGAAATASAFNLLGGTVEYDVDFSAVQVGVNANVYTISPHISGTKFSEKDYCDGSLGQGVPWCVEVDWIESNGDCGGATTLHTKDQSGGEDGCTSWGCRTTYMYKGQSSFHMRIEYGTDGTWTTHRGGEVIDAGTMSPRPSSSSWAELKRQYESKGAVIYSSLWTGWVPTQSSCGGGMANVAGLAASHMSVSNLRITGSVVQGPTPQLCGHDLKNETIVV